MRFTFFEVNLTSKLIWTTGVSVVELKWDSITYIVKISFLDASSSDEQPKQQQQQQQPKNPPSGAPARKGKWDDEDEDDKVAVSLNFIIILKFNLTINFLYVF